MQYAQTCHFCCVPLGTHSSHRTLQGCAEHSAGPPGTLQWQYTVCDGNVIPKSANTSDMYEIKHSSCLVGLQTAPN